MLPRNTNPVLFEEKFDWCSPSQRARSQLLMERRDSAKQRLYHVSNGYTLTELADRLEVINYRVEFIPAAVTLVNSLRLEQPVSRQ